MADITRGGESAAVVTASGSTFSLGWLMADLYDRATLPKNQDQAAKSKLPETLPTTADLGAAARRDLDREKLLALLPTVVPALSTATGTDGDVRASRSWAVSSAAVEELTTASSTTKDVVVTVHGDVLRQLALTDATEVAGYQLGRALRDTCWLPTKARGPAFFLRQFNRDRLAALQGWLGQVSSTLPAQSAEVVSRSLRSWQGWAEANAGRLNTAWDDEWPSVVHALHQQSTIWHGLLCGEIVVPQTPSTAAWMYAGDSILRMVSRFTWRVVRRFYVLVALLVVIAAAIIALGAVNPNGQAKLWTAIATAAGFVGISGASLRAGAKKAAGTLETSIREAAELDAKAWETTWLPPVRGRWSRLRLSADGIAAPRAGTTLPSSRTT